MKSKDVVVIGAGLVGSLLSIYLRRHGHKVRVFERRNDLRRSHINAGKSINLALSDRGWNPLAEVGLETLLKQMVIPMEGRLMHDLEGRLTFQPYGKQGQTINSISRGGLNALLMNKAEEMGVNFYFEQRCTHVDLDRTTATFSGRENGKDVQADLIFGADGAFSAVRESFQHTERFNYSQEYIPHGYKELRISSSPDHGFLIDKNALHIWPRGDFMLIALPNLDASFTVTLFLPFEGESSFASLTSEEHIDQFFQKYFADTLPLMPSLKQDFFQNPTSSLVTVRSYPWVRNRTTLIGDAAHAIVPFYGQGMNCGFEDCGVLNKLMEQNGDDWECVLHSFQELRKPDADAIAHFALKNFIEMREKVGEKDFLLRKKIEAMLQNYFPDRWIPQYSMVTFQPDMRYSRALKIANLQDLVLEKSLRNLKDEQSFSRKEGKFIVEELERQLRD